MLKWLKRLIEKSDRPPSENQATDTIKIAYPSVHLPDFPLHPMHEFVKGSHAPISRELLANVAAVVLCLCQTFEAWKAEMGKANWPNYADGELRALFNVSTKMKASVPKGVSSSVDQAEIRALARSYLTQIKGDSSAFGEFQGGHLTLLGLTIDFSNTIGYGGVIQNALDFYE